MKKSSASVKQNGDKIVNGEKIRKGGFTAEPALLFHMLASILIYMVVQDFLTEKVCEVNLGYSEEVCTALQQK